MAAIRKFKIKFHFFSLRLKILSMPIYFWTRLEIVMPASFLTVYPHDDEEEFVGNVSFISILCSEILKKFIFVWLHLKEIE